MSLSRFNPIAHPVFTILLCLWADLVWVLRIEWIYNDQYAYGWLALCLSGYLIYLRVGDRPAVASENRNVSFFLFLGIAILSLNRIIIESNPVWRPAIWLHALTVLGITLAFLWKIGGWRWVLHFLPALALILFAVPWPTTIENQFTGGLMYMVSGVVVEAMNLCGFYAEQSGNLIRLQNGWVGVEAACSGVRNFQSTLMSAWFVGELFRFTFVGRGLLLLLSGAASLTINIGRTGLLTWTTYRSGSSLTESIHDPVGHVVSVIAFIVLLIVAFLLRKYFVQPETVSERTESSSLKTTELVCPVLSKMTFVSALLFLLGGFLLCELWYYRTERGAAQLSPLTIEWSKVPAQVHFVEISPAVRGQLKYTNGIQAEWVDPNGRCEWQVFYLSWTKGSVSPFLGVHNPTTCMPASGFAMVESHSPLTFETVYESIFFKVNTFKFMGRPYQVYYGTWSHSFGPAIPFVQSAADRFRLALSGRRIKDRQSLQIVIEGIEDESVSREMVKDFLERTLHSL